MIRSILRAYSDHAKRLGASRKPWSQHVLDPMIAIGLPLSIIFVILSVVAYAGVPCLVSDGVPVTGPDALKQGLGVALLAIPLGCLFVGSIAWLWCVLFRRQTK